MITLRTSARPRGDGVGPWTGARPATPHDARNAGLLEGELLDLYVAILIAVPLALFLKWLWS